MDKDEPFSGHWLDAWEAEQEARLEEMTLMEQMSHEAENHYKEMCNETR